VSAFTSFRQLICTSSFTRHSASYNDNSRKSVQLHARASRQEEPTTSRRRFWIEASAGTFINFFLIGDSSNALPPEDASSSYDTYAPSYDNLDGGPIASKLGIEDARVNLFQGSNVHGRVLEIGVGTGLNMDKYRFQDTAGGEAISSIVFLDVSEGMLLQARARAASLSNLPKDERVKFVKADATSQLADLFGENSLDTVVDTFSLCVLGNEGALRCLKQMKQILKRKEDGGAYVKTSVFSSETCIHCI